MGRRSILVFVMLLGVLAIVLAGVRSDRLGKNYFGARRRQARAVPFRYGDGGFLPLLS
jgi:hypothetical protein